MKRIEILGTGCPRCKMLFEVAERAVKELGIKCELVKVTDIQEIVKREVMMTPALAIDGKVKAAGRVPNFQELKNIIMQ
jgi:small redox-active disulfide protein 2